MDHPGTIELVDEQGGRRQEVPVDHIREEVRFLVTDSGTDLPVLKLVRKAGGMIAAYGPGDRLLGLFSDDGTALATSVIQEEDQP